MTNLFLIVLCFISFLSSGVILLSILFKAVSLFSLKPKAFIFAGTCKKQIYIVDENMKFYEDISFFFKPFIHGNSLSEIPQKTLMLVNNKGEIKASMDDLGPVPNLIMLMVSGILFLTAIYSLSLLMGIEGNGFFEHLNTIVASEHWIWIKFLLGVFMISATLSLTANLSFYLMVKPKAAQQLSNLTLIRPDLKPGDRYSCQFMDAFIQEVFLEQHHKSIMVRRWCVRLPNLYPFPIYLTPQIDKKHHQPHQGQNLMVKVNDKLHIEIIDTEEKDRKTLFKDA